MKKRVQAHTRKTSAGEVPVMEHRREVNVSFHGDGNSKKLRPSVYDLRTPEEARQAAKLIKAFHAEMGEA